MDRRPGIHTFLTALLGGCLACSLAAQAKQAQQAQPEQKDNQAGPVLLVFDPPRQHVLEVKYHEDQRWVYDNGMRGKLTTELLLHWRFEPAKKPGLIQAVGRFQSVVYRGGGLKGEDSEAVKTWIAGEVKEGVQFTLDKRGAANPGVC